VLLMVPPNGLFALPPQGLNLGALTLEKVEVGLPHGTLVLQLDDGPKPGPAHGSVVQMNVQEDPSCCCCCEQHTASCGCCWNDGVW